MAALEWAKDGIRINSLHPDAVYDTGLWTEDLLNARAKAYSMSVEQYKKRNLLKTEVSSKDVAELAAEMCGPLFAKTTAAQVPVDGGNERVMSSAVEPIRWKGDRLELLDQRLLPGKAVYVTCRTAAEVAQAIRDMVVRGAPAIGCAAAFGVVLSGGAPGKL